MIPIEWIASAAKGNLLRALPSSLVTTQFSIDTRTLRHGEFFVALTGQRIDGHRYLDDAFAHGASGALVHALPVENIPAHWHNLVLVDDTLSALHRIARAYRDSFDIPCIAVTGSSGKTTTKEVIAHLLSQRYRTYRSPGNLNSEYGMPLALLAMPRETEAAVFELGLQHPGDIGRLASILRPSMGLITMVGDAHREFFADLGQIADAKWELIQALSADSGLAILNADSSALRARSRRFSGRMLWFGMEEASARIRVIELDATRLDGLRLKLQTPQGTFALETRLLGRHNALNIAAAWAVAAQLGIGAQEISHCLATFPGVAHRMELKRSALGWILDDSYNASPTAVIEALRTLQELDVPNYRKLFVFGEMKELGDYSIEAHREIGRTLRATDIQRVYLLGHQTLYTADYLSREAGWSRDRVITVSERTELVKCLRSLAGSQNLILFKGSRANELDRIVDQLTS